MKQRILVAVIGIPLLLLVLCWLPHWATAALLAALGVIGAHELLAAVSGPEKDETAVGLGGRFGRAYGVCHLRGQGGIQGHGVGGCALAAVCGGGTAVFTGGAVVRPGKCRGISGYLRSAAGRRGHPLAMSCLLRLRLLNYGGGLVLMPLVAAFMSDSAALFTGMACGKHKLASKASPKKTVEGAVGGLVGGALGMIVFRIVFFFRHAAAAFHRLVHGHWLGGRVYGPAGRSELFCYQAPVRHQGLWPPAAGPRRRAGPV